MSQDQDRPVAEPGWARVWFGATLLALALNVLFMLLGLLATVVPRSVHVERIRHAFVTGELGSADYLPYDVARGWHQYNDCNVLQMLSNPDESVTGRAWGPYLLRFWDAAGGFFKIAEGLVGKQLQKQIEKHFETLKQVLDG